MTSQPSVHIRLDRPQYTGSETLSGTVAVQLGGAPPPQHLLVKLWWAARGSDPRLDHRVHVAERQLPVEGDGPLPFEFSLPAEPLSWPGRAVSITWTLSARLQWTDGRDDILDSVDFTVLPGPLLPEDLTRHAARGNKDQRRIGRSETARLILRAGILGLCGLTQTALCAGALATRSTPVIIGVGILSLLVILGGGAVALSTLRLLLRTLRGPAVAVLDLPGPLALGQPFQVRIRGPGLVPWELQWTERAARDEQRGPGGKAIRSRQWPQQPVAVASGKAESGSTLFLQIPAEAPASFACPTRRIDWQLLLWEGEDPVAFPLTVAPFRAV